MIRISKHIKKIKSDDNLGASRQALMPYHSKSWLPMLIFGVTIPCFLFFCMTAIGLIGVFVDIHSPVDTLDDVYQTFRYGILFASACIVLLLGSFRLLCPNLWFGLKIWLTEGRKMRHSPSSVRKAMYVMLLLGLTTALATIPLAVNEYYASAPLVGFHAVVIEKKITTSYTPKRGNTKHYFLKVRSDAGVDYNIGALGGVYQKLNEQDHIYIQTRQGWLGIRFYYAIYKHGLLIYGSKS